MPLVHWKGADGRAVCGCKSVVVSSATRKLTCMTCKATAEKIRGVR